MPSLAPVEHVASPAGARFNDWPTDEGHGQHLRDPVWCKPLLYDPRRLVPTRIPKPSRAFYSCSGWEASGNARWRWERR